METLGRFPGRRGKPECVLPGSNPRLFGSCSKPEKNLFGKLTVG